MHIALAARPGLEVVLQIRILRGDLRHARDGFRRQRRASQVGVEDHATRVDHGLKRELALRLCGGDDLLLDLVKGDFRHIPAHDPAAERLQQLARGVK